MKTKFKYKGFSGSLESSPEDDCLFGHVLFISDLVSYEAQTVIGLGIAFKEAVDRYLDHCKETGKAPNKPYK